MRNDDDGSKYNCKQHMRIEMWPQKGGVIGDKVTLMFRLFNTHLFTPHLLCRHLKAGFFSWEKVMSPEKGHNGPVWAFRMCYDGCRVVNAPYCGRPTTPHFLSDRQLFPAVLHRRRRAFLRFSTFSTSLQSDPRAAFSA